MAIAKWKKIDIHTHTPASKCMSTREKDITPRDWIDAAKGKLDGVVVTDHNSIEWVEKLQNELNKEDNLFIYNGIELSVGDRGKHILIIFNTALSIDNINEILIEMGLTSDKRGRTDICIDHTKFISAVHEYRDSLLIIPAHFFSSKGLGNLANYSWISNYYQKIKFDAIEIRNENEITILKDKISGFNDPSFKEEIKELNNIATVIGSDNPYIENEGKHSINGIGDKYTWFKLSEFTLEGLRQAFLDPESRIKKVFEHNNDKDMNVYNHNYISGIKIKELKHLKGLDLRFSPNLNCIVGGRGTGKSTIVEMIKKIIYTNNNREYEGHHLLKSIKNDTEIDLFYNFGSFVENDHLLKYNVDGVNVVRKDLKTDEIIDVNEIEFPLDIYSQKEIYEMVDEEINPVKESKSKFLEIIDNNIELELIKIREQKDEQITKIKDSYSKVLAHKDLLLDMPKLVSEKASLESKLELIEDYDLVDIMDKKNILKSVDEAMDDFNKNYYDMFNELNRTLIEFDEKHNNKIMELEETLLIFDKNIDIIKYFKEYLEVATNLKNEVSDGLSKMDSIKGKYKEDEHFKNQKDLLDKEIKEIIDKLDIDQEQNSAKEISTLSDRLNTVNSKIEKLEIRRGEMIKERQSIIESIDRLMELLVDTYGIRKEIVDKINAKSDIINVELSLFGDKERWINKLRSILKKETTFDDDFRNLGTYIFSGNIFEKIKKWLEFIYLNDNHEIKNFLEVEKLEHAGFENIWKHGEDIYSSFINIIPDDKIFITIKKDVNNIKINDGSPGEKAAAVLSFIMNQGEGPLIIDQPEDDLDNSLIIDLIVNTIRSVKKKRQIIIVTHNPNIPVLGDSEAIIILERDDKGFVNLRNDKKAGCIEESTIKDGICSIMEGGLESFRKRDRKYRGNLS